MKKLVLFIPLVIFLVMGVFLYQGLFLNPKVLDSALEGKPLPAFQLERLEVPSELVTEKDLPAKVSMLNFWATWCPACKYEHPYLLMLSKRNILPIYGINYRDERALAVKELRTQGDPYTMNLFDVNGRMGLDLGVYGAPETFIVDHNGIIRYRYAGPIDQTVWTQTLYPMIQQLQAEAKIDGAS